MAHQSESPITPLASTDVSDQIQLADQTDVHEATKLEGNNRTVLISSMDLDVFNAAKLGNLDRFEFQGSFESLKENERLKIWGFECDPENPNCDCSEGKTILSSFDTYESPLTQPGYWVRDSPIYWALNRPIDPIFKFDDELRLNILGFTPSLLDWSPLKRRNSHF